MSEEVPENLGEIEEGLQERFSNLSIQGLIARGGMGAVYRAVQTQLDRPVALKILPDEFAEDEVRRNLFVREARAMAKLSHPHLVQLFDFGENDGLWYMVQEWVPGQTLFDHQQNGILEIDEGVRLVREVCAGLQHAHENGVVHRDIKPANIIIDTTGMVKLTDFGLAQSVGGDAEEEEDDGFGTPEYAAPELFVEGAQIDHRADIFAIGVLLFELLTGQQPAAVYQPPSEVVEDLGTRFDAMIARAMQHNPDDRYPSCAEFDQDLYAALTGAEAEATKPRGPQVLTGAGAVGGPRANLAPAGLAPLKSSKSKGASVIGVLVGVVAVVAGFMHFFKEEEEPPVEDLELVVVPSGETRSTSPQTVVEKAPVVKDEKTAEAAPKIAETPKPKKRKKREPVGEIAGLTAIEKAAREKAPILLEVYDDATNTLQKKYLGACAKEARKNGGALSKFWTAEANAIKRTGAPPENDAGIPDRALFLRKGWRSRYQKAAEPLKLLHIDTKERYDLLVEELQRGGDHRKVGKARLRATEMKTFDNFLEFLRGE